MSQRTEMLALVTSVAAVLLLPGQSATYNCSSVYDRIPGTEDLKVVCGTALITVDVNLCAAMWAGFDPARLAMNGKYNNSLCRGTIDAQADPPIVRFELPVNHTEESSCWQTLQTSSIQALVVGSYIDMPKSADAVISYSPDLSYHFSCHYPLVYFFNNSQITASSISVSTNEHHGHFFSSLSMGVYNDSSYSYPLIIPEAGLALRTKVFVEVKATNLTGNFHVLLDHCFATPLPYNVLSGEQHSFFTGCQLDKQTVMEKNGMGLSARFFFEVFRFLQHQDRDKSSMYLHCIVKLCKPSKCQVLFYKDTVESLLSLPMCCVPDRVGGRVMRFNVLVDGELPQPIEMSCFRCAPEGEEGPRIYLTCHRLIPQQCLQDQSIPKMMVWAVCFV
uniref:Si:dkey-103g5.3 n=1 Tax=Paramormyrops kingsleyae TaxID=1676925 RepID=A0A3B3SAG6_9TELE